MDPEALVLAQQAVAALQAMASPSPTWTEIVGAGVGLFQCLLIWLGLLRIREAAEDRQRQHEETMQQMKNQHEQTMKVLDNQRMSTAPHLNVPARAAEMMAKAYELPH